MKKTIKNYTTDIPVEKTIQEIIKMLADNGAAGIAHEYENGVLKRLFFKINVKGREIPFRLPAKPEAVYNALFKGKQEEWRYKEERMKKAEKIAWRVCKLWLEAQLTHINLEQAEITEVFLPYMVTGDNKTLYQTMEEKNFLLGSGE